MLSSVISCQKQELVQLRGILWGEAEG